MQKERDCSSTYRCTYTCDQSFATASTVSTATSLGSLGSSGSLEVSRATSRACPDRPSYGESSQSTHTHVKWNDLLSSNSSNTGRGVSKRVDFERLNFEDCLKSRRDSQIKASHNQKTPSSEKLKEMRRELSSLEAKIQKAAKVELDYLNEAKKAGSKRDNWSSTRQKWNDRLREKMGSLPLAKIEEVRSQLDHLEKKIKKATALEKVYLKKSKQIRGKRYRWTQLYEHTRREVDSKSSARTRPKQLPPLLKPSVRVLAH